MKQGLHIRLGHQLTMTPQLQQAIRLLQLSTLELNAEIQQALEENLMLEVDETVEERQSSEEHGSDTADDSTVELNTTGSDKIPDELPVDADWSSIYDLPPQRNRDTSQASDWDITSAAAETGLRDHLLWQTCLASFSDIEQQIAEVIIEETNDDGYFTEKCEDIAVNFDTELVTPQLVGAVLKKIQTFDPAGVGARDLRESLSIQLRQFAKETPARDAAITLVEEWFELLTENNIQTLRQRTGLEKETLIEALRLIRSCNPRPGQAISAKRHDYITPDVTVVRRHDRWTVESNSDNAPALRVNTGYASLIRRGDRSHGNQLMRDHLQEARWLLKSLQSRRETLLRVAQSIVNRQQAFLDRGPEAMKPMVMRDLADELELHESTISRAVTNKYMLTPRGVFEFRYFFSSHVGNEAEGNFSSTAIRARIKKMIHAEPPGKPLSDNKITVLLKEQGISIARRTVAKYRDSMAIPSSSDRKSMI
ncbi:MAG: RNA polymerase factor sigma-54 [Pseudomonadota bacterium]